MNTHDHSNAPKETKGNNQEEIMENEYYLEPEDLSCVEDEDRIFILDADGKSVELEVKDDAEND